VSENLPLTEKVERIPEAPTDPGEVASAARSCSVILLLGAALLLIVCLVVGVALTT